MRLSEFADRLDDRLRTDDFAAIDASPNGLQVGSKAAEIDHAAFAVDAAAEPIRLAAESGADVLCVHHGLIWDGLDRLTGRDHARVRALLEADLGLYVSHLPLDAHQTLGNAAGLADALELRDQEPFGWLDGPEPLGRAGRAADPVAPAELRERLASVLDHGGAGVAHLAFGPETIESVAIVTGAGADAIDEAVEAGTDALVTGEGRGRTYHEAREAGLHVYLAGHYATETFGVAALESLAAEWGLETTFVDCPTGL